MINSFITKQDSSGNVLWAKKIDGTNNVSIEKITTDSTDNIYITGEFSDTVGFGDTIFTNSDTVTDIFLVKLNPFGEVIWAKQFEVNSSLPSDNETLSSGVVVDIVGDVYITGHFKGTLEAETTTLTSNSNSRDPFIIKTNSLGNPLWAKKFESSQVSSALDITTDDLGKVYIVGGFSGTIDFDGVIFNSVGGTTDAFVLKIDDLGTMEWIGSMVPRKLMEFIVLP